MTLLFYTSRRHEWGHDLPQVNTEVSPLQPATMVAMGTIHIKMIAALTILLWWFKWGCPFYSSSISMVVSHLSLTLYKKACFPKKTNYCFCILCQAQQCWNVFSVYYPFTFNKLMLVSKTGNTPALRLWSCSSWNDQKSKLQQENIFHKKFWFQ